MFNNYVPTDIVSILENNNITAFPLGFFSSAFCSTANPEQYYSWSPDSSMVDWLPYNNRSLL
jgi:hypothetical protein